MANLDTNSPPLKDVLYMLNHVFLPPKLPQEDDNTVEHHIALCDLTYRASLEFASFLSGNQQRQWSSVSRMLEMLLQTTRNLDQRLLQQNIMSLGEGGFLALRIRAQNAALIIRRRHDCMVFESFEVQPLPEAVMQAEGKLLCSYPGPAVELCLEIAQNLSFVEQLASFLVQMDVDELPGAQATTVKAESKVPESRSTAHPRYITQLLSMILLGLGKEAEVNRITKRIADDVCWKNAKDPWRRSPLWLVIRIAIQTTVNSREVYKQFMIFLQMKLLRLFLAHDLSSELLYVTRIKTSRRFDKLGTAASPYLDAMRTLCEEIEQRLQERWSEEQQRQARSPSYTPVPSDFEEHTTLSLSKSHIYLTKVMCPESYVHASTEFCPSLGPRICDINDFHNLVADRLTHAVKADPYVALADFEFLVQERLDSWVVANKYHESACLTIDSCLKQYTIATKTHYSSNPEDKSLMLLTVMELWVALDMIAIAQCSELPDLSSYSPEIPASFLDCLLLRRGKSTERATRIQLYLRDRHSKANCTGTTSIYSNELDQTTFAIRYFQESPYLHALKDEILQSASNERNEKLLELRTMNKRHSEIMEKIYERHCKCDPVYFRYYLCERCLLQREADGMRIDIQEWPLPNGHLEAEAIVFELKCPRFFAIWRGWTYAVLRDFGMSHKTTSTSTPYATLEEYTGLAKWSTEGISGRILFGSTTKSFLQAHYRQVNIPAQEHQVCLNNGLHFQLYDSIQREYVASSFDPDMNAYCTLQLHGDGEGLYQHLQDAVTNTTHTHNETIVNQGDCPPKLGIHEHLAFANLRCGSRLQWNNIARELRANVLTFSREEVHTLITQAIWQIGPISDDGLVREWHVEPGLPEFGLLLIREGTEILSHVKGNWMEVTTVKSIIYLISRLLTFTHDEHVRSDGFTLLRKAREITHMWTREIVQKLQRAVGDEQAHDLRKRACEMAATCRATFDADPKNLHALLHSPNDISILIECTIIIHDNTPPHLGDKFPDFQKLLHRDRRLSHDLEHFANELAHWDQFMLGLEMAIKTVWPDYRSGNRWQRLDGPNSRWLTSSTTALSLQRAQRIHYNILDGSLLVDAKPIGRLPHEIVGNSTYRRIFGEKILDVIPADMDGMDYATRSTVSDHKVFFAFRAKALIIRAKTPSNQILELIPHEILRDDFPALFSARYAHWMIVDKGIVEFRPLDRLWKPSAEDWRLLFIKDGRSRLIYGEGGTRSLIDIQSPTFRGIAARISPLECSEYLTVIHDSNCEQNNVFIELPRLRLSFFISDNEIESKNMPGMIIDDNQCIGTMIGLDSRLILRQKDPISASLPRSRCVLIPYGDVRYTLSPDHNHVRVQIDTRTKSQSVVHQVVWYKYEIDPDLGMLVSNASTASRFYRIFLHALCSHPLPDPLTGQTGTDHALEELSAAGSFSFRELTDIDVTLLRLIGKITPERSWYPTHLRCMQTTEWSSLLPALSQHSAFHTTVQSILRYAQSLAIFSKEDKTIDLRYSLDTNPLTTRARWKNAIYYEESVAKIDDTRHDSRDLPHFAYDSLGSKALNTTRLVYSWPEGLTCSLGSSDLLGIFQGWGHIRGPVQNDSLTYTREWLDLDLRNRWLTIYDICRRGIPNKFELLFSFAALAYSTANHDTHIPILLSFATMREFSFVPPPEHLSYDLADGFEPCSDSLRNKINSGRRNLMDSPSAQLTQGYTEGYHEFWSRRQSHYTDTPQHRINVSVSNLLTQWPCSSPQSPFYESDDSRWFEIERIMRDVEAYFTSCSRNKDLLLFLSGITKLLQEHTICSPLSAELTSRFSFVPRFDQTNGSSCSPITLKQLFSTSGRSTPTAFEHKFGTGLPTNYGQHSLPTDARKLENLIFQFQQNRHSPFARVFSERLETSRRELGRNKVISDFLEYRQQCTHRLAHELSLIRSSVAPSSTTEQILMTSGLWPRIHLRTLLNSLASISSISPTSQWAENLTKLAEIFIEYQLSQRLVAYAHRFEFENIAKELQNAAFNKLDAMRYQDWLLIQIQGNFITRTLQSEIAHEMIAPSSGRNTVLQLNMGEGKSHVIVPLVTVALADSRQLVRVIVPKPLSGQMFHLLADRISGLANRRVFYLPFSRDVKMDSEHIQSIGKLFEECIRVQGVLVAQPEHILSFRLMVIDRLLSSGSPLEQGVQELQKIQARLTSTSRDILDESDELLHVRYQLIYTMGEQQPLDGDPDRWTITQNVLDLVRRHMRQLHGLQRFFEDVELVGTEGFGKFPHVRLLGSVASDELVSRIAEDVVDGKLGNLNFVGLGPGSVLRGAILAFILKEGSVSDEMYQIVERTYGQSGQWKGLLLLRGLLAHGILVYVLSRQRWRVDYGLDLGRSLLAVPYRAKDMPSLRSEFGHPDVAICLTCLSYYYGGLTFAQVQKCFDLLAKLDNPTLEYENWVRRGGNDIPESLRSLIGVNTKDIEAFTKVIVPMFQCNQATIDFFLSHVVFPKQAKEFASKLGTSGWDLAEKKPNVTTGFSGTNDNSDLLPTSITPTSNVEQLPTNARVLDYLLRPENERYICTQSKSGPRGQPCSVTEFLDRLIGESHEVRVLLDVGAQMLEMTNQQLVTHWLSLTKNEVAAGVFFDDADQLLVISKDGVTEKLYSSPFYQRLEECIVYLDDAHTRGTDLKLPLHYRAAVTLGPKVTKDRLVQGCMRMRKLGHGQSVVFCAPPEVDKRIRDTQKVTESEEVKVMHVLSWVMSRTCDDIEDHVPHWIQQGVDYHRRKDIDFTASSSKEDIQRLESAWLQDEARSLDKMYGSLVEPSSLNAIRNIPDMRGRLNELGITVIRDARMEEEQEREVSHELEEERQPERAPKVKAAVHRLDNEVRSFVRDGIIPSKSGVLFPLMTPLRTLSENLSPLNPWAEYLLCTRDFMTTTQEEREKSMLTSYLRPVQWILSHTRSDGRMIFVVMSPYEVNRLLQDIRTSKHVRLHMYAPRTTQAMKPLDDLTFYCIPPLPQGDSAWMPPLDVRCQLDIWGGQLYLDKYETYLRLCLLLGISSSESDVHASVEGDRFVPKSGRVGDMKQICLFDKSPITLLKMLFSLRRKGMSYDLTHMGKILSARLVFPEDFEEYMEI